MCNHKYRPGGGNHVPTPKELNMNADNAPLEIPKEMLECLKHEPRALRFLRSLSEGEQNYYVKWVYSAQKEDTRVERLGRLSTAWPAG